MSSAAAGRGVFEGLAVYSSMVWGTAAPLAAQGERVVGEHTSAAVNSSGGVNDDGVNDGVNDR